MPTNGVMRKTGKRQTTIGVVETCAFERDTPLGAALVLRVRREYRYEDGQEQPDRLKTVDIVIAPDPIGMSNAWSVLFDLVVEVAQCQPNRKVWQHTSHVDGFARGVVEGIVWPIAGECEFDLVNHENRQWLLSLWGRTAIRAVNPHVTLLTNGG